MPKKDIIFMCQYFYPEYITSAKLPFQTAISLVESGFSVDVLTGYPSEYMSDENKKIPLKENIDGVNIHRVNYLQLSRNNSLFRLINYFSIVFTMSLRLFKLRKYESIIVYSNPPILPIIAIAANILFHTKIIFVSYDVYPEIAINAESISDNGIISSIMHRINNHLFKRATKIVALSNEMKEYLINNRDITSDKIEVIPNWDTDQRESPKISVKKNRDEKFTLSYLGNMGIPQDFKTLLEAMKDSRIKESNIELVFAGHGNKRTKIEDYVARHQLNNVSMYGYLEGKEYEELKDRTDTYILSLKEELNGQAVPSKFYTYLSGNKPILAIISDKSDIAKEIKGFGLGYQVKNGDVETLVEILLKLSKEEVLYDSREVYKEYYNKNVQLKKYVEMFRTVL